MFLVILRLGLLMTRALTLSAMKGGQTGSQTTGFNNDSNPTVRPQPGPSLLGLGLQSYQLLVDVVREGGAELKFDN